MNTNRAVAVCLALAVIFSCAFATLAGVTLYRTVSAGVDGNPGTETAPPYVDPLPTLPPPEAPAPVDAEFVKEMAQNVVGPAIVQLWDGSSVAGCWILKVDGGKTLTKPIGFVGHYWLFTDQAALDNDWPNSLTQYQANNPQCTAALPAGILK